MRAIILALGLLAAPAMAENQFDLVCKGNDTEVRYRVDLASGEACADRCDHIWKMGQPTAGEIRVIDRQPAFRGDLEEQSVVSRQTGEWRYHVLLSGKLSSRDGQCEPAPFTGFPKSKF